MPQLGRSDSMTDEVNNESGAAIRTSSFVEFASTDPAATGRFLERVFGWPFEAVTVPQGEYLSYQSPGGDQAGIRPTQPEEPPTSLNYVRVKDLETEGRRIEEAGGEIVLPRVDLPDMGSFFWFKVPGGPILACWQDAPGEVKEND